MDTTVILAQPRENKAPSGCRLRPSPGSTGLGRSPPEPTGASAEIDTPKYTRIFPGPPKNRPNLSLLYPQICGQGAYSSCIQVRDLAAQIAARSLPSIYDYCL